MYGTSSFPGEAVGVGAGERPTKDERRGLVFELDQVHMVVRLHRGGGDTGALVIGRGGGAAWWHVVAALDVAGLWRAAPGVCGGGGS